MWEDVNYGELKDFEKRLLYKRIVEWDEDKLVLDDGTVITIECSEQDCCANAGGNFSNVKLDAVITSIEYGEVESNVEGYDDEETTNYIKITIYHNQNPIAQADAFANDGNGGFYYSVGSFVIEDVHYAIIKA